MMSSRPGFAALFLFLLSSGTLYGELLTPHSYGMRNGQKGTYTYFDDSYDGDGDNTKPLAWLSGGVGDLTDGVIANKHWDEASLLYVGWGTINPTITFSFQQRTLFDSLVLYVDDAPFGGVYPPESIDVFVPGTSDSFHFPVADPPSSEPFAIAIEGLNMVGESLAVRLNAKGNPGDFWVMLSEVEVFGKAVPEPSSFLLLLLGLVPVVRVVAKKHHGAA